MFLYSLLDLQRLALLSWNLPAKMTETCLNSPFLPFSYWPATRSLAENAALLERNTRLHTKPSFSIDSIRYRGEKIQIKETVVQSETFCRLIHFERTAESETIASRLPEDPKVLIVTPMSGHFSTLLRGTVESMLCSHDVYVTDWSDAKMVPLAQGYFDLEDQITTIMGYIQQLGPDLNIIGVGQAALSTLCATALLATDEEGAQPLTVTLIGGPIDSRSKMTPLTAQAQAYPLSWFRQNQVNYVPTYYPGAMRRVYPGALQLLDRMSMTFDRHMTERMKYFQHLVRGDDDTTEMHDKFYDEFLAVMDVPEEFYIQLVERAYQHSALAEGTFTWRGQKVEPSAITKTALLVIEGELDDLSPYGHTSPAINLCSGIPPQRKKAHLEIGVGHYGMFNGRKWRNNIQPIIHGFIREHSLVAEEPQPLAAIS